jgi:acyl carrier protein
LDIDRKVRQVLDSTLALHGRAFEFGRDTPLLGALPELDSMAVAYLITALEEQLGIAIPDDEIDG